MTKNERAKILAAAEQVAAVLKAEGALTTLPAFYHAVATIYVVELANESGEEISFVNGIIVRDVNAVKNVVRRGWRWPKRLSFRPSDIAYSEFASEFPA